MSTQQEEKTPKKRKRGVVLTSSNKVVHRQALKAEAVARIQAARPVADSARTFHFVLRLLLEEQFTLFYGKSLKTLPGKVRLARLIETTLFAIQTDMKRLANNASRVTLDEAERLKANPDLRVLERIAAFRLLGLAADASVETVKASYKELARKAHPDVGGDTGQMQTLNAAYALIMEGFNGHHPEKLDGPQPGQDPEPAAD